MTILHYFLGFPPLRSGGLTKYGTDLMQAEKDLGHQVYALYPGNFNIFGSSITKFKKDKKRGNTYILTNAMPVPLMYGTADPSIFMSKREIVGFEEFISETRPDVFHVHTLMGLPKEVLVLMKQAGIRIVYTSHDYFGLCPKVNFINSKGEVCKGANKKRCDACCQKLYGKYFLKARNSKFVVPIKKILK